MVKPHSATTCSKGIPWYSQTVRPVCFLGDSLKSLRDFPEEARHDAGYPLDKVQRGEQPDDLQATSRRDIDTARRRFAQLSRGGK